MRKWCAVLTSVLVMTVAWSATAGTWPSFRGPGGDGHAADTSDQLPTTWSETENIAWKIPIAHKGWSTPVVLDDQVWLTTATEEGNEFYGIGVDANTGEVFYNEILFRSDNPEPLGNAVNGYASPSAAIEPGRVYINFGSYGTACLDTATREILWKRDDMACRHYRGPGSSLIIYENLLIITFDGVDVQYVIALDKLTGKTVWKTERSTVWDDMDENGVPFMEGDRRKGFSTPIVHDVNGVPVLVTQGASAVFGYDARDGAELWKIENPGHTPSTSPVISGDLAIIATGAGPTELRGIKLDGKGNVTATHIAWSAVGKWLPNTPSPIVVDGLVYTISDRGELTCVEAANGAEVWSVLVGGNYQASPIYAGGHIYITNVNGETVVVKPGRAYEEVTRNTLDEGLMASPAVSGNAIFQRTKTHLYRIEVGK